MSYVPDAVMPTLANAQWAQVDLAALAARDFPDSVGPNPLLDPEACDAWVKTKAAEAGADFTWGGHFEDRKALWRGYYENAPAVAHLGVDFNAPSGTPIHAPRDCEVVHSWPDANRSNGWGGRLVLLLDEPWRGAPYLVLGHLAHAGLPAAGTRFGRGAAMAMTGKAHENGGWFPHLHAQCCSQAYFDLHRGDLELLDGYVLEAGASIEIAPDPTLLLGSAAAGRP
jgi:hypothetical protein